LLKFVLFAAVLAFLMFLFSVQKDAVGGS